MKLTDEKANKLVDLSKIFFFNEFEKAMKSGKPPGDLVFDLQKQLLILQTLLFSFMISARKKETVASIYGDLKFMSMECLDNMVRNPEILKRFSDLTTKETPQTVLDTMELFRSLDQAMNKGD